MEVKAAAEKMNKEKLRDECETRKRGIMGKFGMLDCANNFANTYGGNLCRQCGVVDNESHRINDCPLYALINRYNDDSKVDFDDIFCESDEKVLNVVRSILTMWDLERGNNQMRAPTTV